MTDGWDFERQNGSWKRNWHTRDGQCLKLIVIGDADHLSSPSILEQLRNVTAALDDDLVRASIFAWNSVYRDDIFLADGLDANSIVIKSCDDWTVWFNLRNSHRMIGVRIRGDESLSVYCESP